MKRLRIQKVIIDNFKGQQHIEISLNELINVVSGANGTGKTTILDAIWWLLFGKDSSGVEKFEIRTLDENGQKIHNTEISVYAVIEIETDGMAELVTLKRTQVERWVTKRGTITAELQGNDTSYEVNGFPRKASEYSDYINGIVDEKLFKILSNPTYFPNMPWKEQRDILMQMVADFTDAELAATKPEFACILDDLNKGSVDDLTAKYRKELAELKKQQNELPIRIDEVSKQKVSVDVKQLNKEKSELQNQIDEIDAFLAAEDVTAKVDNLNRNIMDLRIEHSKLVDKHKEEYRSQKHHLEMEAVEAKNKVDMLESQISIQQDSFERNKQYMDITEKHIVKLYEDLDAAKSKDFQEAYSTTCPYCGQELPEGKIEEIKAVFAEEQEQKISSIKESIAEAKKDFTRVEGNYKHAEKSLTDLSEKLQKAREVLVEKNDAFESFQAPVYTQMDVTNLEQHIADLTAKLEELKKKDVSGYLIAKESFTDRIAEIDKELMAVDRNAEIDQRISALMAEQRDVAQRAADVEKKAFTLENFIRFKMDKIASDIDGKFDHIHWKLFNMLLNGGIEQCCECSYNGVGYKNLNSGHQIVIGLRIIDALSKHFGFATTVFVDNAESINSFYIPMLDTQMVFLKVTDDKSLVIQ